MCFAEQPEIETPPAPAAVIEQDAPDKKTANKKPANTLAIGSKRYRNESGLGMTGVNQKLKPSGPSVSI